MKASQKTLALWIVILLFSYAFFHFVNLKGNLGAQKINFSELLQSAKNQQLAEVKIQGELYSGKFKPEFNSGAFFTTIGPADSEKALEVLDTSGASVEYKSENQNAFWQQLLVSWLPTLLLFVFFFFVMRQIQVGGGKALSFGKSKARLMTENSKRMTFMD